MVVRGFRYESGVQDLEQWPMQISIDEGTHRSRCMQFSGSAERVPRFVIRWTQAFPITYKCGGGEFPLTSSVATGMPTYTDDPANTSIRIVSGGSSADVAQLVRSADGVYAVGRYKRCCHAGFSNFKQSANHLPYETSPYPER